MEHHPLRDILAVAACSIACLFLFDCAAFRIGWYAKLLSPDSYAGRFRRTVLIASQAPPAAARPVLLVGNSMMEEGFSAQTADKLADGRVRFVNAAVAGSSLRSWYYVVRELDPGRNTYSVIVVPFEDYNDEDGAWDRDDDLIDLRVTAPALRLDDIPSFTGSFRDWSARAQALQGAILKGIVYRDDFRDFLRKPAERLSTTRLNDEHAREWVYGYQGRTQVFREQEPGFQALVHRAPSPQTGRYKRYRAYWLARLMAPYQGSNTRFLLIRLPRSPLPLARYGHYDPLSAVRAQASRPGVVLADEGTFSSLERPQYFFDALHLNGTGRRLFSNALASFILQHFF